MAAHAKNHDYHLVPLSPWPLVGSISAFFLALGGILWMHYGTPWLCLAGGAGVLYTMFVWWMDVTKESLAGDHTPVVQISLRYGMILFILSEIMFFVAWFWAYFDAFFYTDEVAQYARVAYTGGLWPPQGTEVFDPWHLPLFNTLVLLLSGTTITWAHHALIENDRKGLVWGLVCTVLLGILFSYVQVVEYASAAFSLSGNIYGGTFFLATGFHGFHIFIGTIFLIVCLIRALKGHFTPQKHLGFEFAAWYWHFVDVVWLFLFATIYIWGSWGATISHH